MLTAIIGAAESSERLKHASCWDAQPTSAACLGVAQEAGYVLIEAGNLIGRCLSRSQSFRYGRECILHLVLEHVLHAHHTRVMMVMMGTLLGVDHALAPPTGRQARLGCPSKDQYRF